MKKIILSLLITLAFTFTSMYTLEASVQNTESEINETGVGFSLNERNTSYFTSFGEAFIYGKNNYGQMGTGDKLPTSEKTNVTTLLNLTNETVVSISQSYQHTLVVTSLGKVFAFGANIYGGFGNGTNIESLTPINITSQFTLTQGEKIVKVRVGQGFSLALSNFGSVFSFGYNGNNVDNSDGVGGVLGTGDYVSYNTPQNITGGFNLNPNEVVTDIQAGSATSGFITNQGRLFITGPSSYFTFYNSDPKYNSNVPLDITPIFNLDPLDKIVQIDLQVYQMMVLTELGRVFVTGMGARGGSGLAIGTEANQTEPYELSADMTFNANEKVVDLGLGMQMSGLLTNEGRFFVFGFNDGGQLGMGSTFPTNYVLTPILHTNDVWKTDPNETIVEIDAGASHMGFISSLGNIYLFGQNDDLSIDPSVPQNTKFYDPTLVYKAPLTKTIQVLDNEGGILFSETRVEGSSLSDITLPNAPNIPGYTFDKWSASIPDTLGTEDITITPIYTINQYTITFNSNDGTAVSSLTADFNSTITNPNDPTKEGHTFAGWYVDESFAEVFVFDKMPLNGKTLYANWTVNSYIATFTTYENFEADLEFVLNENEYIVVSSTYRLQSGVITSTGRLLTWGANGSGQLGDGTTVSKSRPVDITSTFDLLSDETFIDITFGLSHAVALTSKGRVFSWGNNNNGQLGDGTVNNTLTPNEITSGFNLEIDETIVNITTGYYNSIALSSTGRVFTWGNNGKGQLGRGSNASSSTPIDITSRFGFLADETVVSTAFGLQHVGLVTSTGRVFTWGLNLNGQLGNGTLIDLNVPTEITANFEGLDPTDKISFISFGAYHSSALSLNGEMFIWGFNGSGQLGNGNKISQSRPMNINSQFDLNSFEKIGSTSLGLKHSSAITTEGRVFMWGENTFGQLGDRTLLSRLNPVEITSNIGLLDGEDVASLNLSDDEHTLFLTTEGRLFSVGKNNIGQLGHGDIIVRNIPKEIFERRIHTKTASTHVFGSELVPPTEPVKAGFVFNGWYTDSSLTTTFDFSTMPATNLHLYAEFLATVELTFTDFDGNTITTYTFDPNAAVTNVSYPDAPVVIGYTFDTWSLDIPTQMGLENITIQALYDVNEYTITFNSNGGSAVNSLTADFNSIITKPEDPTKEGHSFAGWYVDEALSQAFVFNTMPAEDVTLFVKWNVNRYTITVVKTVTETFTFDFNADLTSFSIPDEGDNVFRGFYEDQALTIPSKLTVMPNEDVTLHAKFENIPLKSSLTLTFEENGGNPLDDQVIMGEFSIGKIIRLIANNGVMVKGDINGDGFEDIIIYHQTGSDIEVLFGAGNGTFETKRVLYTLPNNKTVSTLVLFDIDSDNDLDLLVSYAEDSMIVSIENDGLGSFSNLLTFVDTVREVKFIRFADMNNDNTVDLVTGETFLGNNDIKWYPIVNNVLGSPVLIGSKTNSFHGLEVGDLNKDGFVDVVVSWGGSQTVTTLDIFYGNNASGTTFTKETLTSANFVNSFLIVDLDGDQDLDIVATIFLENKLVWFENIENVFTERLIETVSTRPSQLSVGDLDMDGHLDIVLSVQSQVLYFKNNGSQEFSSGFVRGFASNSSQVVLLNIDGDQDLDVIHLSESGLALNIAINNLLFRETTFTSVTPVRANHLFVGWFSDEALTIEFDFTRLHSTNQTVYAKWEISTYTFVIADFDDTVFFKDDFLPGADTSSVVFPTNPLRIGYTFIGWDAELPSVMPTENLNIKPIYEVNTYTVTLNANGGSTVADIVADYESTVIKPADPTKEGYTFAGWYADETLTESFIFDFMPLDGATIYGKWTVNSYDIFITRVGIGDTIVASFDFGDDLSSYTLDDQGALFFRGFFTDEALTIPYIPSTMPAENMTIFAKFSALIEYDLSNVTWAYSGPLTYNGNVQEVLINLNTLPEGVSILRYEGNRETHAGTYEIKVFFNYNEDTHFEPELTFTFTIEKAVFNMSNVKWVIEGSFLFDTLEKQVVLEGLPAGLSATYTNQSYTNPGTYTTTVEFTYDSSNYQEVLELSLTWTIIPTYLYRFILDGDVISSQRGEVFDTVNIPVPTKTGYIFKGFDQVVPQIFGNTDIDFTATFMLLENKEDNHLLTDILNAINLDEYTDDDIKVDTEIVKTESTKLDETLSESYREVLETVQPQRFFDFRRLGFTEVKLVISVLIGNQTFSVAELKEGVEVTVYLDSALKGYEGFEIVDINSEEIITSLYDAEAHSITFIVTQLDAYGLTYQMFDIIPVLVIALIIIALIILGVIRIRRKRDDANEVNLVSTERLKEPEVLEEELKVDAIVLEGVTSRKTFTGGAKVDDGYYLEVTKDFDSTNRMLNIEDELLPQVLTLGNAFIKVSKEEAKKLSLKGLSAFGLLKKTPGSKGDKGYYGEVDLDNIFTGRTIILKEKLPPTSKKGHRWVRVNTRVIK